MLQDATDEFNAIHSAKAKAMLNEYLIGCVGETKAVQAKLPGIKEDEVSVIHLTLLPEGERQDTYTASQIPAGFGGTNDPNKQ